MFYVIELFIFAVVLIVLRETRESHKRIDSLEDSNRKVTAKIENLSEDVFKLHLDISEIRDAARIAAKKKTPDATAKKSPKAKKKGR